MREEHALAYAVCTVKSHEHLNDGRIRYRFPTPIAAPYRISRIARTPALRLGHTMAVLDQTVRFSTWVLLSEYIAADVRDDDVESLLRNFDVSSTAWLRTLCQSLLSLELPTEPLIPAMRPSLLGEAGDQMHALVSRALEIPIARNKLDLDTAGSLFEELAPQVSDVLTQLHWLEDIVLVRVETLSDDTQTMAYLHPWRGVGFELPIPVGYSSSKGLEHSSTLLIRPGDSRALRMDPFYTSNDQHQLLSLMRLGGTHRLHYEHYLSGSVVERDGSFEHVLAERRATVGYTPLPLDIDSFERLSAEYGSTTRSMPGFRDVIFTGSDTVAQRFRAVCEETNTLHSVAILHDHMSRNSTYMRTVLEMVETVQNLHHPNLVGPICVALDSETGRFIFSVPYPANGRLSDRLPPGGVLPVQWSVDTIQSMLMALVEVGRRGLSVGTITSHQVVVEEDGVVRLEPPFPRLSPRRDRATTSLARLLYRMLTGKEAGDHVGAPSLERRSVPVALDGVVMTGLRGGYLDDESMLVALQRVSGDLRPEAPEAIARAAIQRTFSHLQRLVNDDVEQRSAAIAQHENTDDVRALTDSINDLIESIWDPNARLGWIVRVAEILGREDGAEDRLLALYRRSVELAGDHTPTLRFVASRYREALRSDDLIRLFQQVLHTAEDVDQEVFALTGLAQLAEERGDPEAAGSWWRRLVSVQPENPAAWRSLCNLARANQDERALAHALERYRVLCEEPEERLNVSRELAVLRAGPMNDPKGAIEPLREVLMTDSSASGAWEVLRDIARELHDDSLLNEALQGLSLCEDLTEQERYSVAVERANALGLRGDQPDTALAVLEELGSASPNDTRALSTRALILVRAQRWTEAVQALEGWIAAEENPWSLTRGLRVLAPIVDEHGDDPERVTALYEAILDTDATDPDALRYLEMHHSESAQWDDLARILQKRADSGGPSLEVKRVLGKLADVQEQRLQDLEGANRTLARLLRVDPTDGAVLERYLDLVATTDTATEAAALIEQILPQLGTSDAKMWRERIADSGLEYGDTVSTVLVAFQRAAEEEPTDIPTLEGLAQSAERVGDWQSQADALERLAALETTIDGRVARLYNLMETVRDRLLDSHRAAMVCETILELVPDDLEALRALAALGPVAGRTLRARLRTLRQFAAQCSEPDERLGLLESIVSLTDSVEMTEDEQFEYHEQILSLDGSNRLALEGLEALHRRRADWDRVLAVLQTQLDVVGFDGQSLVYKRIAKIQLEQKANFDGALNAIRRVLDEDPNDPEAQRMWLGALEGVGQYAELADALIDVAERSEEVSERASLLVRLGTLYANHLHDSDAASEWMERAAACDPENVDALAFLADEHVEAGAWDDAKRVLEGLLPLLSNGDLNHRPMKVRRLNQLGQTWAGLGLTEKAQSTFQEVLELDAHNLVALRRLMRLSWDRKEHDQAEEYYRRILMHHGEVLTGADMARFAPLVDPTLDSADDEHKRLRLERLVKLDNENTSALRELVAVYDRMDDGPARVQARHQLAALLSDPLEKFTVLVELAQVLTSDLNDPEQARTVLAEAQGIRPDSIVVPVQLLEVNMLLGDFQAAVETLQNLIEREDEPERLATYTYTLGLIQRDHLKDRNAAIDLFNETLDLCSVKLEAFEALDQLLVDAEDWEEQAKSYLNMLRRVQGKEQTELEHRLYRNLGQIYRTVIPNAIEAITALTAAIDRAPDDLESRIHLAQLLEEQDPGSDAVLAQYRAILDVDPNDLTAWHALGRIFAKRRNRDAVWCVCGVMTLLGHADSKEQDYYNRYRKPALALRKGVDGDNQWQRLLFHRDQCVAIGQLFELLARVLGEQVVTGRLKHLGVLPTDQIDASEDTRFVRMLGTVSKVLAIPIPTLFRSSTIMGVSKGPLYPPVLVAGADVLEHLRGKKLRFELGKVMAYFLPSHLLAGLLPVADLNRMLQAALHVGLADGTSSPAGETTEFQALCEQLNGVLRGKDRELFKHYCEEVRHRHGTEPDLQHWLETVECTANHAGQLLCNDLEVAVEMLKNERKNSVRWSGLPLKRAVEELAVYTVSDAHFELRKEVGSAVLE